MWVLNSLTIIVDLFLILLFPSVLLHLFSKSAIMYKCLGSLCPPDELTTFHIQDEYDNSLSLINTRLVLDKYLTVTDLTWMPNEY